MLKEFRNFIARGNVLDLAVAVIMGAAFGNVVKSLVDDIIMPPIGRLLGGIDFSNFYINLSGGTYASLADARAVGAATINYGLFINNVISFLIIALAVFVIVKAVNQFKQKEQAAPTLPTKTETLLTEIRDLLKRPG